MIVEDDLNSWKLVVEYDGTKYRGWQEQRNARSVAGELRNAAESFLKERVELGGAGRTDAGVHALGQTAHLRQNRPVKPLELSRGINDNLPSDINVLRVDTAPLKFDARRDAVARQYLYRISTRRTAFQKKYVWWVKDTLDIEKMSAAAGLISGRHDFASFCDKRLEDTSTVVVVESAELSADEDMILFRITASHFLWKMVRRLVGTLVEIGRHNMSVADFQELLDSQRKGATTRKQDHGNKFDVAAHTAPPSGLFLEAVFYRGDERTAHRDVFQL